MTYGKGKETEDLIQFSNQLDSELNKWKITLGGPGLIRWASKKEHRAQRQKSPSGVEEASSKEMNFDSAHIGLKEDIKPQMNPHLGNTLSVACETQIRGTKQAIPKLPTHRSMK
jgi:hypothetical protein